MDPTAPLFTIGLGCPLLMREKATYLMFGFLVSTICWLLVGARAPQSDLPPYLIEGKTLFGLKMVRPTDQILFGVAPATGVTVLGNRGKWFLLSTPNQPRGPEWVNFDHVVSYRTDQ